VSVDAKKDVTKLIPTLGQQGSAVGRPIKVERVPSLSPEFHPEPALLASSDGANPEDK
jgi:hypothetical protein